MIIVGLIIFSICLIFISTYPGILVDFGDYRTAWEMIMNWDFYGWAGMQLVPAFIFFIVGIILMIIGLIYLIIGLVNSS